MNIDNDIVLWGIGIVGSAVASWSVIKYKVDQLEKDARKENEIVWGKIHDMETWKEDHDREVNKQRMDCERRMSGHDSALARRDAQYEEIIHRLDEMKVTFEKRFERIENKIDAVKPDPN